MNSGTPTFHLSGRGEANHQKRLLVRGVATNAGRLLSHAATQVSSVAGLAMHGTTRAVVVVDEEFHGSDTMMVRASHEAHVQASAANVATAVAGVALNAGSLSKLRIDHNDSLFLLGWATHRSVVVATSSAGCSSAVGIALSGHTTTMPSSLDFVGAGAVRFFASVANHSKIN